MIGEHMELKTVINDDCRHTRPTVCAGHLDAVSNGIDDARTTANHIVYLACCDIFTFPAKGVADPIDKMKIALSIYEHQIASTEPAIALGKDIAQNLIFGLANICIAFETLPTLICVPDT